MRIYNCVTDDDGRNRLFRFAGHDAYYETFGDGEWYGKTVATVAVSKNNDIIVVGWAPGYIKSAKPFIEEQVTAFIERERCSVKE